MVKAARQQNTAPKPETPFEQLLIDAYKPDMIEYVTNNPKAFTEALALAQTNRQPFAWRSAWLLWSCIQPKDPRLKKSVSKLIEAIPRVQDNQKRELLKIVSMLQLREEHESKLFDLCIDLWKDIQKASSIRIRALMILEQIAAKYPELSTEITLLNHRHFLDTLSPGIRQSACKIFAQLPQHTG